MVLPLVLAAATGGALFGVSRYTADQTYGGIQWTMRGIGEGLDEVGTAIGDAFRWVDRQFTFESDPQIVDAANPATVAAAMAGNGMADWSNQSREDLMSAAQTLMDNLAAINKRMAEMENPSSPSGG